MGNNEVLPLYKRLIDDLKKEIDDQKFRKGDLLPSENELCRVYSTTRATVRLALTSLSNMGYIVRHQGKGSIVSGPPRGLGILSVSGVTAGVGNQQLNTLILNKPVKQAWPPELLSELDSTEELEAGCIFFSRLRSINRVPIIFEETFISDVQLPRFTSRNLENKSFLTILREHYNVEVVGGNQKIWSILADKATCKLLQLQPGSPVAHLKRRLKTNVKNLNIYSWIYCNTENYYLDHYF